MMEITTLMNALELIKEECSLHNYCSQCPLGDSSGCFLSHADLPPDMWSIYDGGFGKIPLLDVLRC